jgi:hypothetical protein
LISITYAFNEFTATLTLDAAKGVVVGVRSVKSQSEIDELHSFKKNMLISK